MSIIGLVFESVLRALYEHTGFSIVFAFVFMFVYMEAKDEGWEKVLKKWWSNIRSDSSFGRMFLFVYYVTMVLFRTLLNRELWMNPLSEIMGGWGLYSGAGDFTAESIANVIFFIPLIMLLFWNFHKKIYLKTFSLFAVMIKAIGISFVVSLGIELCQLFFRLGSFQIADLCYNTLGGLIGGLLYWSCYKIWHRRKRK